MRISRERDLICKASKSRVKVSAWNERTTEVAPLKRFQNFAAA